MSRKTKAALMEELVEAVRANQTATDKMDEAATRVLGINRTDGRCLDVIQRAGRISAGHLAVEAGLTSGSVTAVIDRLESKGLVRRVADPGDRRRVLLEQTELAERRSWELWGPLGERGLPYLQGCSIAELELLIAFMQIGTDLNENRAAELRAQLSQGSVG